MVNQGTYDLRHDVDRLQNKVNIFENDFTDSYFIETSVPAIFYKNNVFYPTTLTFYSYKDSKGKTSTYKGTLKVYSSVDGTNYTLIKTSTDANTSIQVSDNTIKFYKCELYNEDNELYDTQTVPLLKDGVEGKDGSSAISIFLGNEAQLIPCTSDGKVQETISFTIPFYCYKGTSMYTCNYSVGSTNYWTQQGFTYKLDKQCSATDNGQITITAPKDSTLRGLKHSIISMDFVVDGQTITKEFNWAKVIKGEDGVDGVDGDDGQTPVMYVRYSKTQNPSSLSETITYEQDGYDYQGIAWVYGTTTPTLDDYKPFTNYDPDDGVAGADGCVHIAYSLSSDGSSAFTTGKPSYTPLYLGTYTDHTQTDSQNYKDYKWTLIKGTDGITPSTETIKNVISKTTVNATTLDGNTADMFIPVELPVTTIYRDESDKTQNYVKIYQLGQLIICQLIKFNGSSTTYGQLDTDYFRLLPSSKDSEFPENLRPQGDLSLYVNDLNNADGSSNGRLRLTPNGAIAKLGKAGTSYNNTYGTFIYPIVPRQDTTIEIAATNMSIYGDYINAVVTSNGTNVSNVPVLFTFTQTDGASEDITQVVNTDSNGDAKAKLLITPEATYTVTMQCTGNKLYNKSSSYSVPNVSVNKTTIILSANYSNKKISGTVQSSSLIFLPNIKVLLNNVYVTTTDSEGKFSFSVSANGTYTVKVGTWLNEGVSADKSVSITVTGIS